MTIPELFQMEWYFGFAFCLGVAAIVLIFVYFGWTLLHDKYLNPTKLDQFIDDKTIKFAMFVAEHFDYGDDEPECPEWADPELWKESLKYDR